MPPAGCFDGPALQADSNGYRDHPCPRRAVSMGPPSRRTATGTETIHAPGGLFQWSALQADSEPGIVKADRPSGRGQTTWSRGQPIRPWTKCRAARAPRAGLDGQRSQDGGAPAGVQW